MQAKVVIDKSFDDTGEFTKTWENGDFEEFFKEEGEYLDRLSNTTVNHGSEGDGFTVTYTVTVEV